MEIKERGWGWFGHPLSTTLRVLLSKQKCRIGVYKIWVRVISVRVLNVQVIASQVSYQLPSVCIISCSQLNMQWSNPGYVTYIRLLKWDLVDFSPDVQHSYCNGVICCIWHIQDWICSVPCRRKLTTTLYISYRIILEHAEKLIKRPLA